MLRLAANEDVVDISSQRIAVLIPCYNEELTVADVVRDFRTELPQARIYVFDNNSTDQNSKQDLAASVNHVRENFNLPALSEEEIAGLVPLASIRKGHNAVLDPTRNPSNQKPRAQPNSIHPALAAPPLIPPSKEGLQNPASARWFQHGRSIMLLPD